MENKELVEQLTHKLAFLIFCCQCGEKLHEQEIQEIRELIIAARKEIEED